MEFEETIALVTGGGRGIGRAISLALASQGSNVVVNYVSDLQSAQNTAKQIKEMGSKTIAIKADVSNFDEVDNMVHKVISEMGRIDILVNNAGIRSQMIPAVDHSVDEWDRVLDVHLRGTYLCCRRVGREMIKQQFGRIVNLASLAGMGGTAFRADYGPAKAAIINLTKTLAVEWARYNIRVNSVAPGIIETDLIKNGVATGAKTATNIEKAIRRTPMRRSGLPEEVAGVALFLLSDDSSFVTGVNIPVDGGWTADIVGY